MNWEAIGAIAEAFGAIGVIASLLYLGVQIRRDRTATALNTTQMRQNGARDTLLALATSEPLSQVLAKMASTSTNLSPGITALMETYNLSHEEVLRVNAFYVCVMRQTESNLRMPMTDEERSQTLRFTVAQLDGAMGLWWDKVKENWVQDFVKTVDNARRSQD